MGTSLIGLLPQNTYSGLIKIGDNTALDGTLKTLSDGAGNDTVLALSNTSLQIGGSTGATWDNTNKRLGIGTATPGATLDVHSSGATVAQFNKTVSGNSYIQQLMAGTARWKYGFTTATGAFDIIDDVNALTRLSVLNTGQLKLNAYTSTSAFTGTTAGFLAFDASGNILSVTSPATSPSGVAGSVQFSDGTNFASDGTKFFWDNTNKRLGVGTNAPLDTINAKGVIRASRTDDTSSHLTMGAEGGYGKIIAYNGIGVHLNETTTTVLQVLSGNVTIGNGTTGLSAKLGIKGSGSTSATTSLLVQNSAATSLLTISDNGDLVGSTFSSILSGSTYLTRLGSTNSRLEFLNSSTNAEIAGYYRSGGTFVNLDIYSANLNLQPYGNTVNIGTQTSVTSAVVNIQSTTKGFLPPRMTTAQKNAIASPASGLQVFDSTMNAMCEYNGTAWRVLSAGAQSVAASTATTTVDMSAGNVQNITLTASTTLTLSSATVGTYIMKLIQGGSGSYTVTWPGTVIWSGGTAPTLTTTVGKVDIVTLVFDGTNFYGNYSLNY